MRTFDLGMAPLAGLAADQNESLFARIGPRWEPRYSAAPGSWTLPIVLAEVAMLTNAGREAAGALEG